MLQDLRIALRSLAKAPGFVAVVALTLALGIGSSTTVFCWLQSVWLNPLPGVARQSEMRVLATAHGSALWHTVSPPDLHDARELKDVLAGIVGSQMTPACLTVDGKPEWIYGQIATANYFDVLGVRALHGRTFLPDEDRLPGGNNVLVLGEAYWRRRFAADPSIIGRQVEINRHAFTIVGVVPGTFRGTMSGLVFDFWAPVSMHREVANFGSLDNRWDRWLHTQARLAPGVDEHQAQAALDTLSARLTKAYPDSNDQIRLQLLTFAQAPYGVQPVLLPALRTLLVVCFGVLLIVAANIANLLLARASTRQREIGIRLAVGASRTHLVRLLLAESFWLSLLGGAGGMLLASWLIDLLGTWMPPTHLPIGIEVSLNLPTLAFAGGISLVTGLVFGLVPAWQSTRPDLNRTLKEGGRGAGAGAGHHALRHLLVITEIALALVLLIGSALCIRSVQQARHADLGLDPSNVLLAGLRIGMHGYTEETGKIFYGRLQQRLAALPGVVDVALASTFPLGLERSGSRGFVPEGYVPRTNEDLSIPYAIVSPRYFSTMKIPLLDGRDFNDLDDEKALPVAIINEVLAKRFWAGLDPIGRNFRCGQRDLTVIAVTKPGKHYTIAEAPQPFFYTPYGQGVWDLNLGLCVRTAGAPAGLVLALREEIHRLDPAVEIWAALPMTDHMKAAFIAPMFAMRLLLGLGAVALVLAAMGVYAVMAYSVTQRRSEFGVRMALGAATSDILRQVLRQGLSLAALGIAAGLVLSVGVTRLLAGLLYGVSPFDPATFVGVPLLLTVIAVLAAWLPARRATRVAPSEALRNE